jgi:hypothetical protein
MLSSWAEHNHAMLELNFTVIQEQQQQRSGEGGATADPAAAERLKAELVELRASIRAARSAVRQTRAQMAAMDRDLATHGAVLVPMLAVSWAPHS